MKRAGPRKPRRSAAALRRVVAAAVALAAAGCGAGEESRSPGTLTIYSGRSERLVWPLLHRFEEQSGIDVEVRYGETAELAAMLFEEGDRTPAEVFFSQDAAELEALSREGLLVPLEDEVLERVPEGFRGRDWVGLSGRSRVVVFNTEATSAEALPRSLSEVADPRHRGRFGIAPTNGSFQAHMALYLALHGEPALRELLEGIAANEPRIYRSNTPIVQAVIAGEIDWGLVNHYYLLRALSEDPDAPAENFTMPADDGSAFVNVAGIGLLTDDPDARELARFLVSPEAQRYFAEETHELPLVEGVPAPEEAAELAPPRVPYGEIAAALPRTLELIQEVGLTRFR